MLISGKLLMKPYCFRSINQAVDALRAHEIQDQLSVLPNGHPASGLKASPRNLVPFNVSLVNFGFPYV